MIGRVARRSRGLPALFAAGVALTLLLTLAIFYFLMRPPASDMVAVTLILSTTGLASIAAAHVAYRRGWISLLPHLNWQILAANALLNIAVLLAFWVTAELMYVSRHDLLLTATLMLFQGGLSISIAYALASSMTDRIALLSQAAHDVASGRLDARVPVSGEDEVSRLAATFNEMAVQLDEAYREQRRLIAFRQDMVSWIGHDLRTPLAAVRAIVEALADRVVSDPDTVERYLQRASHQIDSIAHLLDDLSDIAQIDAGVLTLQRDQASIGDLISDSLAAFSTLAKRKGVALQGSVADGMPAVTMDTHKIGRVIANLLQNALNHTPEGGSVCVAAHPDPDGVVVELTDTGDGIASEDLPHVFEVLYRGRESRSRQAGGSGLGLAIASGILEAHGGEIGIESQLGQGTRVWFRLPV